MEERIPDNAAPQGPTRAIRLIFEYEGEDVRLVSQQPVDMALTDPGISQAQQSAYYIDTRDASGNTLDRVKAHGAFATSAEVFPEQHGDPITRVDVANLKGAFTVITPAPDEIDHVAVLKIAVPPVSADGVRPDLGPADIKELASFPLSNEIRTKKEGGNQ